MAELTYREAVARGIAQEMARDPDVVFLGEDVAKADETLLSAKAYKEVARSEKHAKRIKVELSGVTIPAFLLREKAGKKSSTRQGGLPIDVLEYLFER